MQTNSNFIRPDCSNASIPMVSEIINDICRKVFNILFRAKKIKKVGYLAKKVATFLHLC